MIVLTYIIRNERNRMYYGMMNCLNLMNFVPFKLSTRSHLQEKILNDMKYFIIQIFFDLMIFNITWHKFKDFLKELKVDKL